MFHCNLYLDTVGFKQRTISYNKEVILTDGLRLYYVLIKQSISRTMISANPVEHPVLVLKSSTHPMNKDFKFDH